MALRALFWATTFSLCQFRVASAAVIDSGTPVAPTVVGFLIFQLCLVFCWVSSKEVKGGNSTWYPGEEGNGGVVPSIKHPFNWVGGHLGLDGFVYLGFGFESPYRT